MTTELQHLFNERVEEVRAYVTFLERCGTDLKVTSTQQHILYGGVYLHLYNLVESTVRNGLHAVQRAVQQQVATPIRLNEPLFKHWVRLTAGTHRPLAEDKRLDRTLALCRQLVGPTGIEQVLDLQEGGGNWDDTEIQNKLRHRVGLELRFDKTLHDRVKHHRRDNLSALRLVKEQRNKLAHGELAFGDCGAELTAGELRELADVVIDYLGEVVRQIDHFIALRAYLRPENPEAHEGV